jgi:hypothetical protein
VGGRAAAHGRVSLRSGGRLRGRLGGRRVSVRLPGYGVAAASAFRATFARRSSRSRLVPSPAR